MAATIIAIRVRLSFAGPFPWSGALASLFFRGLMLLVPGAVFEKRKLLEPRRAAPFAIRRDSAESKGGQRAFAGAERQW
jgi:hypothetical protein